MLSRRGLYRTKRGTIIYILRWMAPYYIELIARNPALKIQIWRSLLYCAMTSRQLTPLLARRDKCQKQNADPIDLFRDNSMDLEFNIQGCGLHKSWRGLKILHFGTSVVCWGCPGGQIFLHSTVLLLHIQSRPIKLRIFHQNERCRISAILWPRKKFS